MSNSFIEKPFVDIENSEAESIGLFRDHETTGKFGYWSPNQNIYKDGV